MLSTASSYVQSGRLTVAAKGYRFTASRSMGSMLCSRMTSSSVPRRPRRPPCIFGCRVLTRPPMISGKPVCSATSLTGIPWLVNSLAVPPVDNSSMPRSFSSRANSTMPVLSETLSSARRTGVSKGLLVDAELFQLLAQGSAIDPEDGRRAALISLDVSHDDLEQGLLDLAHHHVIE